MTIINALGRKEFPATHSHKLITGEDTELLIVWRLVELDVVVVEISGNTSGRIEFTPVDALCVDSSGCLKGKVLPISIKKSSLSPDYINASTLPSSIPIMDEWTYRIECCRQTIRRDLEIALRDSMLHSNMQYSVYIDEDGGVWIHEDLTGSNWTPIDDNVRVITVYNGNNWSWKDAFSPEECLKMVLSESSVNERDAFAEWKIDNEYDDDVDASTMLKWWDGSAAEYKCKLGSIDAVIAGYDFEYDIDRAIEMLKW